MGKRISKVKPFDNWSISGVWNDLLTEERQMRARDYIRASEIGSPFLDRYLKMRGVPFTNKFEPRTLRVFDTGKIFEVDVMERIFRLLGLLIDSQGELKLHEEGLLRVIGHHDPMVGGKIDLRRVRMSVSNAFVDKILKKFGTNKAFRDRIEAMRVPEWMQMRVMKLARELKKQYPDGMRTLITEMKTVNSRAFWSKKNIDPQTGFFRGYDHHKLQLWTYLKASGQPEGRIFYMSKDDLTLQESVVFVNNTELEAKWREDISKMTHYYMNNIEPGAEPSIVYNDEKQKFEPNWRISHSNYFTYITGFQTEDEWVKSIYPRLKELNSSICKVCKKTFSRETLDKNDGACGRCAKAKA